MTSQMQQISTTGRGLRRRALAGLLAALVVAGVAVATDAGAATRKGGTSMYSWNRKTTTTRPTTATTKPTTTTTSAPTTTTAPSPSLPAGVLRRAALRITITTTSDWAQLDLPGVTAGHLVTASTGTSEMVPLRSGVVVRGAAGVARSVNVDVVIEVPSSLSTGWATLQQGGVGSTSIVVENRTAAPAQVLSMSTPPGGMANVPVSMSGFMGATQLQWKRADSTRRVLAFTYPWFDESAATDPRLTVHPSEPWRSWDPDDALRASQLARQNGIDGFVMSWAGAASHGLALYQTLAAAQATNGTATILLETSAAGSAAVAEQWLAEALEHSTNPAFLRLDGVPVVFLFDSGRLSSSEWAQISQRLAAAGRPVRLIADTWSGQGGPIAGQYRYNALLETETDLMTAAELTDWNQEISRGLRSRATLGSGEPGLFVATVQPGWDDRLLRGADRLVVDRAGTGTYDSTWSAALAGEADWVVVTSWNEWYEGTGIAPSVEHGTTALTATRTWAQRFRG